MWGTLPASGLGERDPRRPYATGGLGAGVYVFVPGPEGEIIVAYGAPVLEFIDYIIPEFTGAESGVAQIDLTWVRALGAVATLVYADSPKTAQLLAAQSVPAALWRVSGPFTPSVLAMIISGALTGAEVPQNSSEVELVDTLTAEMTGALDGAIDPALYAGRILSSQES